jgi:hypothetical protein
VHRFYILFFSLLVLALLIAVYIYTGMRTAIQLGEVPVDVATTTPAIDGLTEAERLEILAGLAAPSESTLTEAERVEIMAGLEAPATTELTVEERAAILEGLGVNQ